MQQKRHQHRNCADGNPVRREAIREAVRNLNNSHAEEDAKTGQKDRLVIIHEVRQVDMVALLM